MLKSQRTSPLGTATEIFVPAFVLNLGWELVKYFLYVISTASPRLARRQCHQTEQTSRGKLAGV